MEKRSRGKRNIQRKEGGTQDGTTYVVKRDIYLLYDILRCHLPFLDIPPLEGQEKRKGRRYFPVPASGRNI